jgi:thiamine biosynthesis lipoprotein
VAATTLTAATIRDAGRDIPVDVPSVDAWPERSLETPAMGGRLLLQVVHAPGAAAAAGAALSRTAARVGRWADRLTRFSDTSDLASLNRDPARPETRIRPTLAAVLAWAERAADTSEGRLDVTLLDQRLAAQFPDPGRSPDLAPHPWRVERDVRGGVVHRGARFRFDLDGVAKGWIADRALDLLGRFPAALVDADGDIAMRLAPGLVWHVGIADPRPDRDEDLAVLRFDDRSPGGRVAIATSGISVHRWEDASGVVRHHLLDPVTRRPARTDVVQATVIAGTAREAEVLAKSALIAGADEGLDLLDRSAARGAVLLLDSGEVIALPRTMEWLP